MAKRIFYDYGVELYKDSLGYKAVFDSGDHGGRVVERRISKSDAEGIMSSYEEAAIIIKRIA